VTKENDARIKQIRSKIRKPSFDDYYLNMVIYGDPGSGKTTLAATANQHEDTKDVFFLDINRGLLSVAEETDIIERVPEAIEVEKFSEVRDIFWFLANEDHEFNTVVIDTFTDLQEKNLEHIVGEKLGKSSRKGSARDSLDDRWREDYGESTAQLTRLARSFRDLPMHTIFICHRRTDQDDKKRETVGPALTPSLQTNVIGMMDIVGYMYLAPDEDGEGMVHRTLFQSYDKYVAKDRTPGKKLPMTMDNASIPKIINTIKGGKKDE